MAKVVGGFGSGHTPLMSVPGEMWSTYAQRDPQNRELILPPSGKRVTYDELLAAADPRIKDQINEETFVRKFENIQKGLDELNTRFGQVNPDVVVMFGDDQSELFFDDNYPMINLYWGDTMKMLPRTIPPEMNEAMKIAMRAYGEEERDYPVDSGLGLYLIEALCENDFDIGHTRYLKETYGGSIGPATWYLDNKFETKPRPFGMPHAFAFPVVRWFGGKSPGIVPITINTCYPPNWISARRAYALGRAVRKAIDEWDSDKTVAFACSGGLSHFVVDEELDRIALKGMAEANGEILSSLPRARLQSATTETLNWVATAGAMGDSKMDILCYEPGYRTPAGTGCGCGCGVWEV
jgi:Catalytic LigB subunit of aromatic ring-opening dioxygenase